MSTQQISQRHSSETARDSKALAGDIRHTRSEMDETLDELVERFQPRHLFNDALDYFRNSEGGDKGRKMALTARDYGRQALQHIRNNPVPALLAGAGLTWLLLEDSRPPQWMQQGNDPHPDDVERRESDLASEWKQDVAAWDEDYDWSQADESEESWTERSRQALEDLKFTIADKTKSARERIKAAAAKAVALSGHKQRQIHARWASLDEHSGSFVDARTGEPYDETYGRNWRNLTCCDYAACAEWNEEDEKSWGEKASQTLDVISQSLNDAGTSAQHKWASVTGQIGEFVQGTRETSADFGRTVRERSAEFADGVRTKALEYAQTAREGAQYSQRRMSEAGRYVGRRAQRSYEYSRERVERAMDEQPLAVGLGVLALGVVAGLALPRTRYEDEFIGETADDLRDHAVDVARDASERGRRVAAETARAAVAEAERQGLAPHQVAESVRATARQAKETIRDHDARESAGDLADRVGRVADAAKETAREETKQEYSELTS